MTKLCKALQVSRSGFYQWRQRPESEHSKEDRRLATMIQATHEKSRKTYGCPRVHADLAAHGVRVSRKRVARIMKENLLVARARRRYRPSTMSEHDQPVAPNILGREFEAERPNQRWVGDTSELLVGESGRLFIAAIIDLFSRIVVGWALGPVNDRHLTLKALDMALRRRCPSAGLLHHSDQGSTYASEDYRKALEAHGITCSMSRRGNCYDNAAMESWFSTLKFELGERFESYAKAREEIFDYIEVFYNSHRRHSSLNYLSPAEMERRARQDSSPRPSINAGDHDAIARNVLSSSAAAGRDGDRTTAIAPRSTMVRAQRQYRRERSTTKTTRHGYAR